MFAFMNWQYLELRWHSYYISLALSGAWKLALKCRIRLPSSSLFTDDVGTALKVKRTFAGVILQDRSTLHA